VASQQLASSVLKGVVLPITQFFMLSIKRKEPGTTGKGRYFHVEVRPSADFSCFYTEDVGRTGHSLLVLGKRKDDDKWCTHKWLISKGDAYISEHGKLESEDLRVKQILDYVDGDLTHKEGDVFYVRSHRGLGDLDTGKQRCSKSECPDMYFENYEDYEKYEEDMMNKSVLVE
jgi:hypothetical protein